MSGSPKSVSQPRPKPPAHRHRLLQAAQVNVLARMRPCLQPLDVLEVYDSRAVDAYEVTVRETLLPFAERFRRRLASEVRGESQCGAIAFRLDGHDVAHADERALLAEAEEEAIVV